MEEASLPPIAKGIQVIKTGSELDSDDPNWSDDEYQDDNETTYYDILNKDGKKIGSLEHESFFGEIYGELYGRQLPTGLKKYALGGGPLRALHGFLKSDRGAAWLRALARERAKKPTNI